MSSGAERREEPAATSRPNRLRLASVERERLGEFACRARVVLAGPDGALYEGATELPYNEQNYLRVVCRATVLALGGFWRGGLEVELIGLRALRIFDTGVLAVQLASRAGGRQKLLLGIALTGDDPGFGASRAVLHATNRLIGNVVER